MEIERKFLVAHDGWREHILSQSDITQFYLTAKDQFPTVRLRSRNNTGYLTIKYKSMSETVLARREYEYEIPVADVEQQAPFAVSALIRKTRYQVAGPDNKVWEVDVFIEPVKGLVLAEIELDDLTDDFESPDWLGKEVTQDHSYSNLSLSYSTEE